MDMALARDSDDAMASLRYKPSVRNGRVFAAPTATLAALAAARWGGTRAVTSADCWAQVAVEGELGAENDAVLTSIMGHVANATKLRIDAATDVSQPKVGEFFPDPDGRPGCLRVLLGSLDDVRSVYEAVQGLTVQVGTDRLRIRVSNDVIDARATPGGAQRRH